VREEETTGTSHSPNGTTLSDLKNDLNANFYLSVLASNTEKT
jgi:hypothetical protein